MSIEGAEFFLARDYEALEDEPAMADATGGLEP